MQTFDKLFSLKGGVKLLERALLPDKHPVVSVEAFEGPLDLLLVLIEKNELDILNIPIAAVTEQYCQALARAKRLDFALSGEFFVMAAHLMMIKAKILLNETAQIRQEERLTDSDLDPRLDLVTMLLEYKALKEQSEQLALILPDQKPWVERLLPESPILNDPATALPQLKPVAKSVLIECYKNMCLLHEKKLAMRGLVFEKISVESQRKRIEAWMEKEKAFTFADLCLYLESTAPYERVTTLLGLLELSRAAKVSLHQEQNFAAIHCICR